jgi:dihydroneopterin aldolase
MPVYNTVRRPDAPDVITLKAMRFHARLGVYPHEHELAQPVEIDLSVEVDHAGGAIVDYAALYESVAAVMRADHIDYVETVAERVAEQALRAAGVAVAHVAGRKPHVTLPGPLDYAEIRITRVRAG